MTSRNSTNICATILFVAFVIVVQAAAQQVAYTVIDLGTFGGSFSWAFGLNNRGQATGFATLPVGGNNEARHAFLWQRGVLIDLGTLGGVESSAGGINNGGLIAGFAQTSAPDPLDEEFCSSVHQICRAFVWRDGVMTALPTLGGNNAMSGGVNARGQVVGRAETDFPDPTCAPPQVLQYSPVIWADGEAHELPTIPGDPDGWALSINQRGQVVGVSTDCNFSAFHAVLWQDGTVTDLGNLGGSTGNIARSINNHGQIVGQSSVNDQTGVSHAFLWTDGVMKDLGTVSGDSFSAAWAINDNGQVTGISCNDNFICRAFLWERGVMTDLNELISSDSKLDLINASTINARGQIAGLAFQPSTGQFHAFLATPTHGERPGESATGTRGAKTRVVSNIVWPENIRNMLLLGRQTQAEANALIAGEWTTR